MTRIVVALVTVPLYLHHIGDARYGVMSIVWVLLGLFGFLDLGLSRAVTNALAKLRDAPQAHRARALLTTFGLNLGIGLMGGVVLYVFGGLMLKHFVSMPEEIMLRMAQADSPDAARREGIKIAQEMLESVRPMVQGVQVAAPFGRYNAAAEVIASVLPQATRHAPLGVG